MNLFALLKDEQIKRISINQEIQKQLDDYLKDSIDQFEKKKRLILKANINLRMIKFY